MLAMEKLHLTMGQANLKHENTTFDIWLTLSNIFKLPVAALKSPLDYKWPNLREVIELQRPKL